MKKNRIIFSSILIMIMVTMCFSGCSYKKDDAKERNIKSDMSRSDFAGLLGSIFGFEDYVSETDIYSDVSSTDSNYANIQALSEWGVYDKSEEFKPDDLISLEEALSTTVKTVGIDKIKKSGVYVDETDLVDFYISNIAVIDTKNLESTVNQSTAKQIVDCALQYSQNLILEQQENTVLADGVKEAVLGVTLNADGCSGELGGNVNEYNVGDIVYFEATDSNISQAVKITEIDGDEFTYVEPTMDEVFESVDVSGTYDCTVVYARSVSDSTRVASGRDLYNEIIEECQYQGRYGEIIQLKNPSVNVETSKNSILCTVSASEKSGDLSSGANFKIGIENISATIDYDYKAFAGLNYVTAKLSYDTVAEASITNSYSRTIPLAEVVVNVAGPINIRFLLEANIAADGTITVTYSSTSAASVTYKKGLGLIHNITSKTEMPMEAHSSVSAQLAMMFEVRLIQWGLVNAEVSTGIAGKADLEADILEGKYVGDVLIWVPLEFGVNQKGCLVTDIMKNAKYKKKIWDSETSPYKWKWHFDNSDKPSSTEDGEEIEIKDENGEPIDEYKMFDFEPIDFDFINLTAYVMFIDENESQKIGISHIPEDYTENDLVYEVQDTDICTVSSDGTVTALRHGSTFIKISTSDRTTCAVIAVTVSENLTIEDFESL